MNRSLFFASVAVLVLASLGLYQQHRALEVAASQPTATPETPYIILIDGSLHPTTLAAGVAGNQIVRTIQDWATTWPKWYTAGQIPPPVNFADHTILVITGAAQPTTGYSISTTSLSRSDKDITVTVDEITPGPHCQTAPTISQPFQIVSVQAPCGTATVVRRPKIVDCT